MLLGGESAHTLQRVVEFCDGWFPRARGNPGLLDALDDLKVRAARAGRDVSSISVTVFGAPPDAAVLDRYAEAGISRALFRLPSEGRETVFPLLDQYARLIR